MPRYAYICENCNKIIEVEHSMTEKLTDCQECLQKFGDELKGTLSRTLTKASRLEYEQKRKEEKVDVIEELEYNKEVLRQEKEKAKNRML